MTPSRDLACDITVKLNADQQCVLKINYSMFMDTFSKDKYLRILIVCRPIISLRYNYHRNQLSLDSEILCIAITLNMEKWTPNNEILCIAITRMEK